MNDYEQVRPHVVILGAGASRAAYGNALPLMDDIVEIIGLCEVFKKYHFAPSSKNLEEIYLEIPESLRDMLLKEVEKKIYDYFNDFDLPDTVTLYDKLILSLRPKDVIASFNWDPLLLSALRRNAAVCPRMLPKVLFLHGNTGTGVCLKDKRKGYIKTLCEACHAPLSPVKLLYPVKEKDYTSDSFIRGEWSAFENAIKDAHFVTIFGYSAPKSDVEAVGIMEQAWRKNAVRGIAQIEIIDIKDKEVLGREWGLFIRDNGKIINRYYDFFREFSDSWIGLYPRRTCEALIAAQIMNNPIKRRALRDTEVLSELQEDALKLENERNENNIR